MLLAQVFLGVLQVWRGDFKEKTSDMLKGGHRQVALNYQGEAGTMMNITP